MTLSIRAVLGWSALAVAVLGPVAIAATSEYLAYRSGIYIAAGFAGIVAMALVAVFAVAFLYALHRAVNVLAEPLTVLPAQSGWLPQEHALSRFHARWYPASIVFLAFDVEMLFMYPWAVVVAEEGMTAVVEMFLFLGALLIAVTWAWREGVFRWV